MDLAGVFSINKLILRLFHEHLLGFWGAETVEDGGECCLLTCSPTITGKLSNQSARGPPHTLTRAFQTTTQNFKLSVQGEDKEISEITTLSNLTYKRINS